MNYNTTYDEDIENHTYAIRESLLKSDSPELNKNYDAISNGYEIDGSIVSVARFLSGPKTSATGLLSGSLFNLGSVTGVTNVRLGFERTLNEALVHNIGAIEAVERMSVIVENGVKKVFTIINNNSLDIKRAIYDKEVNILDEFPNDRIEFHVIWRENRNIEDTISFSINPIFVR